MIIIIAGHYPKYDKHGVKCGVEYVASHGINTDTDEHIIVSQEHPTLLGAVFNKDIGEWMIE